MYAMMVGGYKGDGEDGESVGADLRSIKITNRPQRT